MTALLTEKNRGERNGKDAACVGQWEVAGVNMIMHTARTVFQESEACGTCSALVSLRDSDGVSKPIGFEHNFARLQIPSGNQDPTRSLPVCRCEYYRETWNRYLSSMRTGYDCRRSISIVNAPSAI